LLEAPAGEGLGVAEINARSTHEAARAETAPARVV